MVGFTLNIHNRGKQSAASPTASGGIVGLEVTGRPLSASGGKTYLPVGGAVGSADPASLLDAVNGAEASLVAAIGAAAERLRAEIRAGAHKQTHDGRILRRTLP